MAGARSGLFSWGLAISIALLKILDDQDIRNPATVRDFLPIIRSAFSAPQFASVESDKKPRVTLFLLEHLQQEINDVQVRLEIEQTINFVRAKTGEGK
jgi:hypothetical protein